MALFLIYGYIVLTITSGTVVCRSGSFCQAFFSNVSVTQGLTTYKSVSPAMMRYVEGVTRKKWPLLRATAGATATAAPMTDIAGGGTVPVGTTGQYQNLYEELSFSFELPYASSEILRRSTALRTMGKGDTLAKFKLADINITMLGLGNTSVISYGAKTNMYIATEIIELVEEKPGEGDLKQNIPVSAFYELEQAKTFESAQTEGRVKGLAGAGYDVLGWYFRMQDNCVGAATVATGKALNDLMITSFKIQINGGVVLIESSWKQMKRVLRQTFQFDEPLTSGLSETTGLSAVVFVKDSMDGVRSIPAGANIEIVYASAAQATATDFGSSDKGFLTCLTHFVGPVGKQDVA